MSQGVEMPDDRRVVGHLVHANPQRSGQVVRDVAPEQHRIDTEPLVALSAEELLAVQVGVDGEVGLGAGQALGDLQGFGQEGLVEGCAEVTPLGLERGRPRPDSVRCGRY